ncbi:substrate-binding periplasmic protein [Pseudobacteriovorax antillogorgiicola]|uniref:ABC-type amino acid transport substrate-binding protein n=1 Tax=Pseudobacteriovorax antillogorgiicola TaxID=1513793 RepID=A0A1Y6CRT5_9BACT|nr:transporter substrate-binding domain-containing protein [Pseudobacteriovorax antillogorgiicola]TCS41266.1 ABC-type amino acid transport substrate-binding protein [Pseudobacteriovorax antillogorgiicola]SMF83777.1 ABC-type amino acid transport substrate-binding protein [Pseudobacteriovorax antillogorgiicola]
MNFGRFITLLILFSAGLYQAQGFELKISYTIENYAPFYYQEGGETKGIYPQVLKAATANLGWTIKEVRCPWIRCLKSLEMGDVHALAFIGKSKEREAFAYFDEAAIVHHDRINLLTLKKNTFEFKGFQRKKGATEFIDFPSRFVYIVKQLGFNYGQLDEIKSLKPVYVAKTKQLIAMIVADHIKLGVIYESDYLETVKDKSSFALIQPPVHEAPYYFGFSKKSFPKARLKQFVEQMRKIKESGDFAKIHKDFGRQSP